MSPRAQGDAGEKAPEDEPRRTFNALPAAFYSPETGFGGGIGVFVTFRPSGATSPSDSLHPSAHADRPNSLGALAIYTEKNQTSLVLSPDLYLAHGTWRVAFDAQYSKFPGTIHGIGANTPDDAAEDYTPESGRLGARCLRRVARALSAGLNLAIEHTAIVKREPEGFVDARKVAGREDGLLVGIGPALIWDTRDNLFAPERGALCQLGSLFHHETIGSDFSVDTHGVDLRGYCPLGRHHVLAVQAAWRKVGGQVPLGIYPTLGEHLRGIVEGRYQDRILAVAQAEYRLPLTWRLRGAVFLAAGALGENWEAFELGAGRMTGGVGLRYVLNRLERLHLRADVGVSEEGAEVYFQFSEAF